MTMKKLMAGLMVLAVGVTVAMAQTRPLYERTSPFTQTMTDYPHTRPSFAMENARRYSPAQGASEFAPMRTLYTMDNRFPKTLHPEIGVTVLGFALSDVSPAVNREESIYAKPVDGYDRDFWLSTLNLRMGLLDELALKCDIPLLHWQSDHDKEFGLSDIGIGLQWRAWEDIFGYPFIIPHATLFLPTGDEDELLGSGDVEARLGVTIGTTVNDDWHFSVDASWGKKDLPTIPTEEHHGAFLGSAMIMYDLFDDEANIFVEGSYYAWSSDPEEDGCARAYIGLSRDFLSNFFVAIYAGGQSGDGEGGFGGIRASYEF